MEIKEQDIKILLLDIMWQSDRYKRATSLKTFLITDLDIINRKVNKILNLLRDEK